MENRGFFQELDRKLASAGMAADKAGIVGFCYHRLIGPDGELKQEGITHNLVTSVGDKHIAQHMAFVAGATVGSIAYATIGVNTTAPAKDDTDLGTAISASSHGISATYPQNVTSHSGAGEWTLWRFEWAAGENTNGSIGEVGMWTSVGSFVARALVAPNVNKAAGDTLQIDWGWKFLGA